MGKRGAEKQLTQLNQHEEDTDHSSSDQNGAQGFRKADVNTLAQRVIKVPKSRLRNTPAADAADKPATNSAFSGFSGFGSPAAAAPAAAAASASDTASESSSKGAFTGFSFGQTAANSKPAAGFGSFGASSTTGAFKMGAFGTAAKPVEATTAFSFGSAATPSTNSEEPAAAKSAFTFGSKPSTTSNEPAKGGFSFDGKTSGAFSFGSKPQAPAEEKKPADSAPLSVDAKKPAAFSMPSFQPPTAASASGSSAFVAQPAKPTFSSGFVPPAATSTAATSSSAMEVAESDTKDEEFFKSIRGLNVSLQKRIADALDVNAFVDLTPLLEQYRQHWDLINNSAPASTTTAAASQAPVFDNSRLGAATTVSQPAPAPVPAPEPTAVTAPKFSFGTASNTSTSAQPAASTGGFSFNFGKPNNTASAAPATAATSDSTVESTAAKTPFSFGFGKPQDQTTAPDAEKKPAFSFGFGGGAQQPAAAAADNDEGSANEDEGENEEEEEKREPTTAGEEGETTEHQIRAKLYAWDKALNKYKDLGVGNFKVNTRPADNGTKRARFICRQEGSEKITLNAAMFKAMTIEIANKRDLGILVISEGLPTRYLVRVKTEAMAQALLGTMERVRDQLSA
ncbi:hypothetical protein GGI09_002638 [Coemansia sp. S100]|nr:hypothetical protein LPJ71_001977 [Coemansia sp. S17]KAJ2099735.1 hypothetical protein GGI09_002638 [Coemansia sp. S100]